MSLVKSLLEEATRASSGVQHFVFIVGSTPRIARIVIPGDADKLGRIKTVAKKYTTMKPNAAMPGKWPELIGEGISEGIASRIAYAEVCELGVFPIGTLLEGEGVETVLVPPDAKPEIFKGVDLLDLARNAGGLFNYLTDEIIRRVNGINFDIEMQVVQELGEGSAATTGDLSA